MNQKSLSAVPSAPLGRREFLQYFGAGALGLAWAGRRAAAAHT